MGKKVIAQYKSDRGMSPADLDRYVNEMAKDGWELVTVLQQAVPVKPKSALALPTSTPAQPQMAMGWFPVLKRYVEVEA